MVFESIVAYFLDKYLSNYIDNFDGSKLKIGIWSGDVVLENLYLKTNALDELNLPIKIVFGHLRKLKLSIPWKSLYYESVKVSIDGLTILVSPKSSIKYDLEREIKEARDSKLSEVRRLLEFEKNKQKNPATNQSEDINKSDQQDTFTERLQMQILRNLELQISNIHIRYEDNFSKPEHPFSAGFTLDSIEIKTADENWNPTFLKEDKIFINKLVSLVSFAIYCNSDDDLLNKESRENAIPKLQGMIRNDKSIKYILNPMSLSTKAVLNMKPKLDNFQRPMFDITILLESIGLTLNRLQYFDLVDMLNTIDRMALNAKYHKYQPNVPLKGHIKEWWLFAYNAIAETQIRPKRNQFKWEHIKLITNTRREYIKLLKKKMKSVKLTSAELEQEKKYEDILDVFNLVFARKQAEVEMARIAEETAKKTSWWGWMSSSSVPKDDKEKLSEAAELSTQEKAKLYDAIGYTGDEISYSEYPVQYVNWKIKFLLKRFEISMKNGEYKTPEKPGFISEYNLLRLLVENMEADFSKRPVNNGFKISTSIKSILLTGCSVSTISLSSYNWTKENMQVPILIEPDAKELKFIDFEFEQNPLDSSSNKRLRLNSKPLKITYHSTTINNIVYFFRSDSLQQKKLKNAALKKISQVKDRSLLFMKNNLQNIQQMELNIEIEPSLVIIPEYGVYNNDSKTICINFGHFSFKSEESNLMRNSSSQENDEDFYDALESAKSSQQDDELIKSASYFKFRMNLKQIQILLIDNSQVLEKLHTYLADTTHHNEKEKFFEKYYILTPLDLFFNIHQCIYMDDTKLPAWKLFGNLPLIDVILTDSKLEQIIRLANSIPLPANKSESYISEMTDKIVADDGLDEETQNDESLINTLNVINNDESLKKSTSTSQFYKKSECLQQSINLEFSFEINEIYFKLREEQPEYFDWILFKISSFGTIVQAKTFDTNVNIYLNCLECEYGLLNDIDKTKLYLIRSFDQADKKRLVDIQLLQTDEHSPTLSLLHDNILTNVEIKLRSVDFVLNLIAVKNMIKFAENFQKNIEESFEMLSENTSSSQASSNDKPKTIKSSNLPLLSDAQITHLLSRKSVDCTPKKKQVNLDLIQLKLSAKMDGVTARISTRNYNYFLAKISNFEMELISKLTEKRIELILNSISVQDLEPTATFRDIVTLKQNTDNLIHIKLHMFNAAPVNGSKTANKCICEKYFFKNYLNEDYFDLHVTAHISKLRFMFLFKHLDTIVGLLKIIGSESEPNKPTTSAKQLSQTREKQPELTVAKEEDLFSFLYKVKLDVTVDAPIIIVPHKSNDEKNALLLDCGQIKVLTTLEILDKYYEMINIKIDEKKLNDRCKIPPVIEIQHVTLSDMTISRIDLEENLSVKSELSVVDCSDLTVTVRRNMQPEIFKRIEALNINAFYKGLALSLARSDYTFVIELLESLSEKTKQSDPDLVFNDSAKVPKSPAASQTNKKKLNELESNQTSDDALNLNLFFKLDIKSIQVKLFEEEFFSASGKQTRSKHLTFSQMELNGLNLLVNMFNDTKSVKNNMNVAFKLEKIILDDTRQEKFIRLIDRYIFKHAEPKPMINVSFENKMTREDQAEFVLEKIINVNLSFLRVCVNADYLLLLYDFFVEGLPKKELDAQELVVAKKLNDSEPALPSIVEDLEDILKQKLLCDVRIEHPQFILYENQHELWKTNSLIIDGFMYFKLNLDDYKMKIFSQLSEFRIKLNLFKKRKYEKQNSYLILSPTSIGLTGTIDLNEIPNEKPSKQVFILDIQDIYLNACPPMLNTSLKMIDSIQNSINKRFKSNELVLPDNREEVLTQVKLESFFHPLAFGQSDFWFTPFSSLSRSASVFSVLSSTSGTSASLSESSYNLGRSSPGNQNKCQLTIRTSKMEIKLETGVSDQIPLVCLSLSLNGEFSNWIVRPSLSLVLNVEMSYFNESLNVWEPVIEPVEDSYSEKLRAYQLTIDMITNGDSDDSRSKRKSAKSSAHSQLETYSNHLKVVRSFQIDSKLPLQFVVTRTFLSLLDRVTKALTLGDKQVDIYELDEEEDILRENLKNQMNLVEESSEIDTNDDSSFNPSFNFLIKNELGVDIELETVAGFRFYNVSFKRDDPNENRFIDKIILKNEESYPITQSFHKQKDSSNVLSHSTLEEQTKTQYQLMKFKIKAIGKNWEPLSGTLAHSNLNGFSFVSKSLKDEVSFVAESVSVLDKRKISLRSQVQITNTLEFGIKLNYPLACNEYKPTKDDYSSSNLRWAEHVIKPGKKWSLPIDSINQTNCNFFKIGPLDLPCEMQIIDWNSKSNSKLLNFNHQIFIQSIIDKETINIVTDSMNKIDYIYNIVLLPTVTFYNYLPYSIKYKVLNESSDSDDPINETLILLPGDSVKLLRAKIGSSLLYMEIEGYAKTVWHYTHLLEQNEPGVSSSEKTSKIEFRSIEGSLISLCYQSVIENNCLSFTLFAPYWVLNQTTLKLEYKFNGSDEDINEIDACFNNLPLFLKIQSKIFSSQTKNLQIRVKSSSDWSDSSFVIDAVGNKGTVVCKSKDKQRQEKYYEIGVDIQLSSNNLTKIIRLTPYYILVNKTDFVIDLVELGTDGKGSNDVTLLPDTITPFWPVYHVAKQKNSLKLVPRRPTDITSLSKANFSAPFWYDSKHSTVLTFSDPQHCVKALCVECVPTEEIVRTIIKPYDYGMAPVLVLNCLRNTLVSVKQHDENENAIIIMPDQYFMKTWANPIGKRQLNWSCGNKNDQIYNLETMQYNQAVEIAPNRKIYLVSFLDGFQKVLMFVESLSSLNEEVVGFKEIKGDEFVLNLKSLGLSLIDDRRQLELLNATVSSSSINWGEKLTNKVKVFKAFPVHKMESIEEQYQKYLEDSNNQDDFANLGRLYQVGEGDEVDFERMVLLQGKKEIPLERQYASSVYINYFSSLHQTTLYLVVNKLQIDNQLHKTIFPVMFSKVLPPKSVGSSNMTKPLVEMSMVQTHCQRTKTSQIKYFAVLVQEFSIKVDIDILNALSAFFADSKSVSKKKYVNDANQFNKELYEIKKSYHDLFHSLENFGLSRNDKIYFDKCHISPIKMHMSFSMAGADAFKDTSIILDNPLFKSIGLVLTDIQDVVFMLGYFEVNNATYSWKELTNEAIAHYTSQVIKQGYILVLGLDVLGNPFGLIRGLAEGVESLFYEPWAGLVQGPGEFAEGLGLGISKLVGSTVGGAAGAFSKITGTLGKGLATLSFDKDFQKSRQSRAESKSSFLQNVGQNLVMGVVSGVTGIVEKPLEGAKQGGVEGFFGGLGKGLLGVVTKPTAGVVDFASQSLEGIRKVAVQEESVSRVRPPRCIYSDKIIRPYILKEAECGAILKDLEKGAFSLDRFVSCLEIQHDTNLILIATDRRILMVRDNLVFGNQKLEWTYELWQLFCEPWLTKEGTLHILTNIEERKLFGKNTQIEKVIEVRDINKAKRFLKKINRVFQNKDY